MRLENFIREQREKHGISQSKLGIALGYKSGQFISNVERGLCLYPPSNIAKLSWIFGIKVHILFEMRMKDLSDDLEQRTQDYIESNRACEKLRDLVRKK